MFLIRDIVRIRIKIAIQFFDSKSTGTFKMFPLLNGFCHTGSNLCKS
jgi:hypothetical protein